jgi:hypothetical protein
MHLLDKKIVSLLLERFPKNNIKFPQNNNSNNLLFDNFAKYFVLKPKGKRSYLWFTYYKKELLCILIIQNSKNISNENNEFYKININYDNTLCYNNVLLQVIYFKKNINNTTNNKKLDNEKLVNKKLDNEKNNIIHYFVIDNVLNYNYYKSYIERNDYNQNFTYKMSLFSKILPCLNNLENNNIIIKLPIILDNNNEIFKLIYNLDYELYSISVYSDYKYLGNFIFNNNLGNNNNNNNNSNKLLATFRISPTINQDLYNLFISNGTESNEMFYDLALIDSYKTSVFMNKLFRYIKENRNLDYLEESDEEEEFENIDENKFTNINKSLLIECEYNYKFKKWMPRKISKENLVNKNYLNLILNKKKIFL